MIVTLKEMNDEARRLISESRAEALRGNKSRAESLLARAADMVRILETAIMLKTPILWLYPSRGRETDGARLIDRLPCRKAAWGIRAGN